MKVEPEQQARSAVAIISDFARKVRADIDSERVALASILANDSAATELRRETELRISLYEDKYFELMMLAERVELSSHTSGSVPSLLIDSDNPARASFPANA